MSLGELGGCFTLGVLLHNVEEAVSLPGWSISAGRWYRPVGARRVRFAAGVACGVMLLITAGGWVSSPGSFAAYTMGGYVLAMVLNAFVPHVMLTVVLRRYMPGTATALLLNVPLGVIYLRRALDEHSVGGRRLVVAGVLVSAGLLSLIALLLRMGGGRSSERCLSIEEERSSGQERGVSRCRGSDGGSGGCSRGSPPRTRC